MLWDYKIISVSVASNIPKALNWLGTQGWEVFYVREPTTDSPVTRIWCKRTPGNAMVPAPDPTPPPPDVA